MISEQKTQILKNAIRNIPDFPKPGIQFKDITTLLADPNHFSDVVSAFHKYFNNENITKVAGIEARGFILGGALAEKLNAGFIPVRKSGKLPFDRIAQSYDLEYGSNTIEVHKDAFNKEDVVLIHDDLLATGGTALASAKLIKTFNVKKVIFCFLCELDFLNGRDLLKDYEVHSLLHF